VIIAWSVGQAWHGEIDVIRVSRLDGEHMGAAATARARLSSGDAWDV
jgi:hypothetical protein